VPGPSRPLPGAGLDAVATWIDRHREAERVPGLAVAVVSRDRQVYSHGSGVADLTSRRAFTVDTACHWFSMTKVVSVTATMALADAGRLDLDAAVHDYLPGMLPAPFDDVKVVHLAQHAAGLPNPLPLRWVHPAGDAIPDQGVFLAERLRRVRRPRFAPGSEARYSNLSTVLLGEVTAAVTASTYVDHVRDALLAPLQMAHTGFTYAETRDAPRAVGYQPGPRALDPLLRAFFPHGIVGPRVGAYLALRDFEMDAPACSGLIGPVSDAARFLTVHTGENRLLSRDSARRMARIDMLGKPYDLGLGWFRPVADRGAPWAEHYGGGGGFWNLLRVYPDRQLGIAVMANTTRRWDVAAVADVLAALDW
jgi:CubicO group peptidase (beta-lactamase class C family)